MKTRFSTFDLICEIKELQFLVGMRVNKVYDVDKKTYILKLQKPEDKKVLIIESGARIHTTTYEWPKNDSPSGFTMKLRKHINNKRLEVLEMVGRDRIIHMQFGSGEAAFHLIVELYDKGNMILTDKDFLIINLLRPRITGDEKFLVKETYTLDHTIKSRSDVISMDHVLNILKSAKPTETLKKLFLSNFDHGPALLEHFLKTVGLSGMTKLKDFDIGFDEVACKLVEAFDMASKFVDSKDSRNGFIILRTEMLPDVSNSSMTKELSTYEEFHPVLFKQHESLGFKEFETFNQAIDEFFSQLESQRIDLKVHQQERQALKKLENIKLDHTQRISQLVKDQYDDRHKGDLIEMNAGIVDRTLTIIRSAIANQMDWKEIEEIVAEAADNGDPILSRVKSLRLDINHISMFLWDPYQESYDSEEEADNEVHKNSPVLIELDLDLSAQGNVRKYHVKKKAALQKELKTIESQSVALKSAEKKTKQILREVAVTAMVTKARKTFWFEKFFWFISTENFLVIAGRDQQQNELVVKRYMRPGDIYVHADLHGASSVIVKNPTGKPVPPKTLNEAGHMAVCYSAAWDSKVVTSAWWVESSQVSKSAPTGEYLPTGSFMVRGKKNFLPPSHLILGYGVLFRVSDENVAAHANDRKVRVFDEESVIKEEEESTYQEDLNEILEEEEEELNDEEESPDKLTSEDNNHTVENEKAENVADEKENISETQSGNSTEDEEAQYPDTTVKIDFSTVGKGIEFKATRRDTESSDTIEKVHFVEEKIVPNKGGPSQTNAEQKQKLKVDDEKNQKRGKKGKLKKLKSKYKDQTEEERELRMQILQGKPKADKPEGKKQPDLGKKGKQSLNQQSKPKQTFQPKNRVNEEGEEIKEVEPANDEVDMLDSLVSNPFPDDELMFALPVVGPYNSMLTWKFKVKATPGISKKGKAIKTAMNMFINDKTTSARERDLLKSMKEQDLARNLPGKVKLSAPMLHKNK